MNNEREQVLREISEQLRRFEKTNFGILIPEIGTNIVYAIPHPKGYDDIAAVPGRIRRTKSGIVYLEPGFGESRHVASVVLQVMKYDPGKRCAMDICYSPEIISTLGEMNIETVFIDRMKEPPEIAQKEGESVPWVVRKAYELCGHVPDVTYHEGAIGKEAITMLMGENPKYVGDIAMELLERLG